MPLGGKDPRVSIVKPRGFQQILELLIRVIGTMSFFIRGNQRGGKRKNGVQTTTKPKNYKEKKRQADVEDEISSNSEGEKDDSEYATESDEDEETIQEKRLRLTKEYLKEIENQGELTK